jgi:transposase
MADNVATMYVDTCITRRGGKTYTRHLLRENYRDGKKVKHRTLLNLTPFGQEEVEAIRLALKLKGRLKDLLADHGKLRLRQGKSVGAVWVLYCVAKRMGIVEALGKQEAGKRALWQVLARAIEQGSRLSAVRLASSHAACDILDLDRFDEEDLYENLDWLCEQQSKIEQRLFVKLRRRGDIPRIFLYDVTSSYLEGTENELSAFGYNRDGKKGKRQIVVGLLCDSAGNALSVEVFRGNTQDPKTLGPQIRKAAERFGAEEVTFVGDRGMIKGPQVKQLGEAGFHYITAITKPQIEKLLSQGELQMELFDETLSEVITLDGRRYILRRNPHRAEEMAATRADKLECLRQCAKRQNAYLAEHPRARVDVARRKIAEKIDRLNVSGWLRVSTDGRRLVLAEDAEALAEASKLDGCYCLTTDLEPEQAPKEMVDARYRDLAQVERTFRTCKTGHLELRPVYVRRESRTRGHVFVVMLAYRLIAELARAWRGLDVTVEEGLAELATLCTTEVHFGSGSTVQEIPRPRRSIASLLTAAAVRLPAAIPTKGIEVSTKRKLPSRRRTP